MQIRPAKRSDSADLAILDDIASHGLARWLWQRAVTDGRAATALERGRQTMAGNQGAISWRNATIAETGEGEIAGMVLGYRLPDTIDAGAIDDPVLKPLAALQAKAAGTWYVDALAVYSQHRARGAGRMLLRHECEKADGAPVSLITEDDNKNARALYQSEGFIEAGRTQCVPFCSEQTTQEWLLYIRGND